MTAIISWLLTSKLGCIGIGAVIVVGALFAFKAWLAIHDSNVASAAKQGYVLIAEKTAAEAKAAEIQRQLEAARVSLASFQKRLEADAVKGREDDQKREQEIASYELLLSEANRRCAIDENDLIFLGK